MLVLGIILLVVGFLIGIPILWTIGVILAVIGGVLMLVGGVGNRPIAGRRYWW